MSINILDLIEEKIILFDGAMGTELIKQGLKIGECPESWNENKPEIIKNIHKQYFEAGSDVVLTNSFGGNKINLSSYNLSNKCYELNYKAAKLAQETKPKNKFVAGSIGPTGKFLKPHGNYTPEEFEESFSVQTKGLVDGGVDIILIETQYDLREAICAIKAVKNINKKIPVFVTMTFNYFPRGYYSVMGNSINQCIKEFEKHNIPVIGANCTLDSEKMADLIKLMRKATSLPLLAQANAGQPVISSTRNKVHYSQSVEEYIKYIPKMIKYGVNLIGGCCGTDAEYIRQIDKIIKSYNF